MEVLIKDEIINWIIWERGFLRFEIEEKICELVKMYGVLENVVVVMFVEEFGVSFGKEEEMLYIKDFVLGMMGVNIVVRIKRKFLLREYIRRDGLMGRVVDFIIYDSMG